MTIAVSEDMTTDEVPTTAECSVSDCPLAAKVKGMCPKHYRRWYRHGTTESTRMTNKDKPCGVPGCTNEAKALEKCEMHYARWRKYGDVGGPAAKVGLSLYERAMQMVDDSAGPDACHPWTGKLAKGNLPVMRERRTMRSARRVIAQHSGRLVDADDKSQWVRMRPTCDVVCCNEKHMDVTTVARPGTRKDT